MLTAASALYSQAMAKQQTRQQQQERAQTPSLQAITMPPLTTSAPSAVTVTSTTTLAPHRPKVADTLSVGTSLTVLRLRSSTMLSKVAVAGSFCAVKEHCMAALPEFPLVAVKLVKFDTTGRVQ